MRLAARSWIWIAVLASITTRLVLPALSAAAAEDPPAGRAAFLDAKCNLCHAVPAAGIEAKTTSEKMVGPDLGGPLPDDLDLAALEAYLRKETERDGKKHKKAYDGTRAALRTMVDWLRALDAADARADGEEADQDAP